MPTFSRISVHPIKALEPVDRDRVGITDAGGLEGDRIRAIVDGDSGYVNGKRTAEVHRIRAEFSPELDRVSLGIRGGGIDREFHLDHDREAMAAWLSDHLGIDIEIETGPGGTLTDGAVYGDGTKTGPTVVSEATLREVASWYEGIDPPELRRRLRVNLVVEGVPAFWEDRLYAGGDQGRGRPRRIRIGDVTLEGVGPVSRCVVPTRDSRTGEEYDGFRETFVERRRETLPEWTDPADLEGNFFSVTAATRIPESERNGVLEVGDPVRLVESAVED